MTTFLYVVYVLFFACLFLTNEFFLAYYFFLFVVAPIALAPISFYKVQLTRLRRLSSPVSSWTNPIATIRPAASLIYFWIICFGVTLVLSSALTPTFSLGWLSIFSNYFMATGLFVLITARLAAHWKDFCGAFFTCFCLIVAVNALINIIIYFTQISNFSDITSLRMTLHFGRAPDHYSTTGALGYATALVASACLVITEADYLRRAAGFFASIILFIALCLMQSRGPLFAALGALFLSGCLEYGGKKRNFFVWMSLIAGVAFLMIPELGKNAILRGDNHRFEVWRKFFDLALQRPVLGYGERIQINLEISDGEILGHGHNLFLSAFLRGGFFAFVSILAIYYLSLIKTFLLDLRFKNPIPFCMLATTFIASLVDFDLIVFLSDWQWAAFWLPFGLAVGAEKTLKHKNINVNKNDDFVF